MCQALREWIEEERAEGRTEGRTEGKAEGIYHHTIITIRNMLRLGMSDEDIRMIAECGPDLIEKIRGDLSYERKNEENYG